MSQTKDTTVTCKACSHEQSFKMWTSVNVTLDPDLKQKLLDHSLTTSRCEQCGHTTNVKHSLLYHDMQANLMIWMVPDEKDSGALPPLAASMAADGFVLRRVASLNGLIEKVRIAEDGLDDRLVEVLKLVLQDKLPEEQKQGKLHLLYDQTIEDAGTGPQISFAVFTGKGTSSLVAPKQVYDRLQESMSPVLASLDEEGWNWLDVDAQCASWLMEKVTQQDQDGKE